MTDRPHCCAASPDGVCEQHRQQRRAVRQGIRRRHTGGGQRVIGDSGKAKPAPENDEEPT